MSSRETASSSTRPGFTPGSIARLSPALGSSLAIYHHGSPTHCSRWEESNVKFLEPQLLVQSRGSCVISETHSLVELGVFMNEFLAAIGISEGLWGSKEQMHAPGPWDLKSASIHLRDRRSQHGNPA